MIIKGNISIFLYLNLYAKHRIFIRWMINYLCWIEKQRSLVTLQEEPLTGFTLKAGHNTVKDPLFLVIVSIRNKTAENTLLETLRITFIDNDGKFWPRTWQYFLIIKTAAFWKKPQIDHFDSVALSYFSVCTTAHA